MLTARARGLGSVWTTFHLRHQREAAELLRIPFEAVIEELERALITKASYATKWNQSRTAELLHLKRDKLRYRMKLYRLGPEEGSSGEHDRAA